MNLPNRIGMPSSEALLAKAQQPAKDALRLHPFYKGKIQVLPKGAIRGHGNVREMSRVLQQEGLVALAG